MIQKHQPKKILRKTTERETFKDVVRADKRKVIQKEKIESPKSVVDRPKEKLKKRKANLLIRFVRWIKVIGWLIFIAIVTLISEAKPDENNFWSHYFHTIPRRIWDDDLLQVSYRMQILLLGLCVLGFIINFVAYIKYKDEFILSIILLGTFALFGSFMYLFKYVLI